MTSVPGSLLQVFREIGFNDSGTLDVQNRI